MKKRLRLLKKASSVFLLLILILVTFSYAMFQGGFVSWFLFYSFLPFAIYCTTLYFYPLHDVKVTRVLRKTDYKAGESLQVQVNVKRSNLFPLFYLLIEDHVADRLHDVHQPAQAKALLLPGFKKEFSYEYSIHALPRGEHVFHSFTLKIGDPLGLFEKEKTFAAAGKIIVYPAYSELTYLSFGNQYNQGFTPSREQLQRDTSMAVGIREYQPGDRFSWINWKASAKRNEMMTKEFEQRQSNDVLVVMDCAPNQHFESIVSFTASVLHAVLKKGAQTGLITISKERASFPIRGGEQQLQQLFHHLAKIEAKSASPLEKALEVEGLFVQQTASFLFITAQMTKPFVEKLSFLGKRRGSITVFLIKGETEALTETEQSLIALGNSRGVRIVLIHEGHFAAAFSEVNVR